MIEEMRAQGRTLLVSTHIIDSVDMLWDRTIIMQNGTVRANVTRTELEEQGQTLEQLFFDVTEGVDAAELTAREEPEEEQEAPKEKRGLFGRRKR